jgi:hypothetical protein
MVEVHVIGQSTVLNPHLCILRVCSQHQQYIHVANSVADSAGERAFRRPGGPCAQRQWRFTPVHSGSRDRYVIINGARLERAIYIYAIGEPVHAGRTGGSGNAKQSGHTRD